MPETNNDLTIGQLRRRDAERRAQAVARNVAITPQIAYCLLGAVAPGHRLVNERLVLRLTAAMSNGDWRPSEEPLVTLDAGTGEVVDGVHVLLAVTRSGRTLETSIRLTAPPDEAPSPTDPGAAVLAEAEAAAVAGKLDQGGVEVLASELLGLNAKELWEGDMIELLDAVTGMGKATIDDDRRAVLLGLTSWLAERVTVDAEMAWHTEPEQRNGYMQRLAEWHGLTLLREHGVHAVIARTTGDTTTLFPVFPAQSAGIEYLRVDGRATGTIKGYELTHHDLRVSTGSRPAGGMAVQIDTSGAENEHGPVGLVVAVNDGDVYRNVADDPGHVIVTDDSHRTLIEIAYDERGHGKDEDEPGWTVYARPDRMEEFTRFEGDDGELDNLMSIARDIATGG